MAWWGRIRLPDPLEHERLSPEEIVALALRGPHHCYACFHEHAPDEDCPEEAHRAPH